MAWFRDLSPYSYDESAKEPNTRNVGWLSKWHSFPKKEPDPAFLKLLWQFCKVPTRQMRGLHDCELRGCNRRPIIDEAKQSGRLPGIRTVGSHEFEFEGERLTLGSAEIRVIGPDGTLFAGPNLIFHYVRDHQYSPPQEFVDAVLSDPHPQRPEYLARLRALGLLGG